MIHRIPIGIDDFRKLRERGLEYVDKTDLIRQMLDRPGVEVSLFPRPRRFGKTLNLSMLRYWFEKRDEDLSHLFQDLSIWQAGDAYRAHFQRYPVIFFSFKDTKHDELDRVLATFQLKVRALFDEHRYLLQSERLSEQQIEGYRSILDGTATPARYERAFLDLSACLHAHHGERVILLLDEYDEPIHAGHVHGFAPKILDFMRACLGAALKGNPYLHRAAITGILRVAKENLFSGLNHIGVYSLLRREYSSSFGFTDAEVAALLERCGRADKLDEVRRFYNGYLFGEKAIYNPWSILNYLDDEAARLRPYWLSTSSNDLVKELLQLHAFTLQPIFEDLLQGRSIDNVLEENVVLSDIRTSEQALWSLLVFAGYLKAEEISLGEGEGVSHRLSIPNREVREVYTGTFRRWMEARMAGHGGSIDRLTRAVLGGDAELFEEQLQAFVTNVLSHHDTGGVDAERLYHGFLAGLLAVLEPYHEVRSNRESGAGRPDVLIRPRQPGKPGAVLEVKVARPGKMTLDRALTEARAQLRSLDYAAELRAAGAEPVHALAVAFDGKRVRVAAVPQAPAGRARTKRRGAPDKPAPRAKTAPSKKRASRPAQRSKGRG